MEVDWFVSVDLKDAYFHVPIAPHHRKFLRFSFQGQLPIQSSTIRSLSGPFCICKMHECSPTRQHTLQNTRICWDIFTDWVLLWTTQSHLVPVQSITFISMTLDSLTITVTCSDRQHSSLTDPFLTRVKNFLQCPSATNGDVSCCYICDPIGFALPQTAPEVEQQPRTRLCETSSSYGWSFFSLCLDIETLETVNISESWSATRSCVLLSGSNQTDASLTGTPSCPLSEWVMFMLVTRGFKLFFLKFCYQNLWLSLLIAAFQLPLSHSNSNGRAQLYMCCMCFKVLCYVYNLF